VRHLLALQLQLAPPVLLLLAALVLQERALLGPPLLLLVLPLVLGLPPLAVPPVDQQARAACRGNKSGQPVSPRAMCCGYTREKQSVSMFA
jgi:hypothetical protein